MKKTIFVTLLIGTLSQIGYAQNFDKAKLDRYFNALEKDNFYGSILLTKERLARKQKISFNANLKQPNQWKSAIRT